MRKKKEVVITPEEEEALASVDLAEVESQADFAAIPESECQAEPGMEDSAWNDFALSHFLPQELDPEGRPRVSGLRRVVRLLLGPILDSEAFVEQAPSFHSGAEPGLQPAVVRYRVRLLNTRVLDGMGAAYEMVYSDVADVFAGNCEPEFARFPTAMAATRAEARVLRKALGLQGPAAEEMTRVPLPVAESSSDALITDTQVHFINLLCKRCDINAIGYINSGKNKFSSYSEVPFATAGKMIEHLSGYQTDMSKIPDAIRGYQDNWAAILK
jgi:hypothetical protein